MNIGRNEPCLCGSGKKYKKCCLAQSQAEKAIDFTYRRLREVESKIIDRLFQHAAKILGPAPFAQAWDEFHCWKHSDEYDPENPMNQLFGPYFLFGWEIDSSDTECDMTLEGKTVAESFLETYRARLSQMEVEILKAAIRPMFSFYEIKQVSPGESITLRNILDNAESQIIERTGSQQAQRGSIMYCALFEVYGTIQSLAMSPFQLPPIKMNQLVNLRKELQKKLNVKQLCQSDIREFEFELRNVFFDLLESTFNPPMPELCNSDGDPLVPQTLHFEITDSDLAFQALKTISKGFISEDELRSEAKIKNDKVHEVKIPWIRKKSKSSSLPGSNTVMGHLKISNKKLTVEVNSNKRAASIKRKILSKLKDQVQFKTKVIEDIEGNMRKEANRQSPSSSAMPIEKIPPEAFEQIKAMADEHWNKWLDDKIPALNNKTPRQAAKSKEGRELLEALLNSFENNSSHANVETGNLFQPDVKKIRSQLGLKSIK